MLENQKASFNSHKIIEPAFKEFILTLNIYGANSEFDDVELLPVIF